MRRANLRFFAAQTGLEIKSVEFEMVASMEEMMKHMREQREKKDKE